MRRATSVLSAVVLTSVIALGGASAASAATSAPAAATAPTVSSAKSYAPWFGRCNTLQWILAPVPCHIAWMLP